MTPINATAAVPIAYFWGEDAFEIERAVNAFAREVGAAAGEPLEVWRSPTDDEASAESADGGSNASASKRRTRILDEAAMRLGTAPLFGGGTLVVIRQAGAMAREKTAEQRLVDLVRQVPPGNALAFSDMTASGSKAKVADGPVAIAVQEAGGRVREFPALARERM